jgi:thiamine pyrophosphokinase
MTGVILCGGRIADYRFMRKYLDGADLVISADSGARHCKGFDVVPDLLVGDFDSVSDADYKGLVSAGVEIARFPVEKDMTDSELAIDIALEKGCSRVIMLGALGTRLDHSVSNLFLLKKLLDRGAEGILADENNEARLIDSSIVLDREKDAFLTLLPIAGPARGVTTQGLYYPLENATLEVGSSWGVSNKFSSEKAVVTVRQGALLVILSRD